MSSPSDKTLRFTYCNSSCELSVAHVLDILENVDKCKISTDVVKRPMGGEVYVYEYTDTATKG